MKLHLTFVFAALCAAAPAAYSQTKVIAEIPFDFTVGKYECPAGVWTIARSHENPGILTLESRDGKHRFMVAAGTATRTEPLGKAQIVFNQYGGERFLSQVWRTDAVGSELRPGAAERKLIAQHGRAEKVALTFAGSK